MEQLFFPVLDALLNSLGLNRNFPLAMIHSGPNNLSLGIDDLPTIHGIAQLKILLGHLNIADRTGRIIEFDRDHLELTIGLGS